MSNCHIVENFMSWLNYNIHFGNFALLGENLILLHENNKSMDQSVYLLNVTCTSIICSLECVIACVHILYQCSI